MNILKTVALFLIAAAIFPRQVFAYVDPGTGSYVMQLILAFVFGGLFGIKMYWKKIKSFFSGIFSNKKTTEDEK